MNNSELYDIIKSLLIGLDSMVLSFDMQNFNRGERLFENWSKDLGTVLSVCAERATIINAESIAICGAETVNESIISMEIGDLLGAMEQKDYVLMSDILKLQIKPFLESLIGPLGNLIRDDKRCGRADIDEQFLLNLDGYEYEDNGKIYRLEQTNSGQLTLAICDKDGKYYMHGNENPHTTAQMMINQYYDVNAGKYIVFGLGLGYHVWALCEACHGLVPIEVYESDEVIIELFRRTLNLDYYKSCLEIIYDPSLEKFSEAANSGTMIIHYPSIRNISNPQIRNRMHQLFVQDSSIRNQIGDMLANFRYNTTHITKSVDEIRQYIENKDVILLAAGPSLDKNMEELKRRGKDTVLICVGTAFRKIIDAGITPDFVTFLDSSQRIRAQINGCENLKIPILLASTTTLCITRDYAGDKYIVCQKGMEEAEAYAEKNGYGLFESGGSVSTLIMDVAVRLGAKRIIAVGLDLAYTNNKYHADGAGRSSVIESLDGLVETKSSDGSRLYTTQAMNMYREWFEKYIECHRNENIEFINATEGGARIAGMKEMSLKSVL